MRKSILFAISVLFAFTLMFGTAYSLAPIDNGSFTDTVDVPDFTDPATCTQSWCAKNTAPTFIFDKTEVFQGGFDADSNAIRLWTGQLSSSQFNNFLFYSQDFYEGSRDINFQYRNLFCPSTYNVPVDKCYIAYGYVSPGESFVEMGQITSKSASYQEQTFIIPDGNYAPAFYYREKIAHTITSGSAIFGVTIDLVQETILNNASSLTLSVDETTTFVNKDTLFTAEYLNTSTGLPIIDANCFIDIEDVNTQMVYDAGVYTVTNDYGSTGDYNVIANCNEDNFIQRTQDLNFTITALPSSALTIDDLVHATSYNINDSERVVEFQEGNEDWFSFSLTSTEIDFPIGLAFEEEISSKQYYVYVSDTGDANDWVFDSSLTYGSSANYNDPIQKLPLRFVDDYQLNYTTETTDKVYFKFVFNSVGRFYETIGGNSDWVSFNTPNTFTDSEFRVWDEFQNSQFTNIYSYNKLPIPEMTSGSMNTGFEFQFTAYSSTPQIIKVGQLIEGVATTVDVTLSTTQTRYSIPVSSLDVDAQLIILSDLNTPTTVYMTNYALVPISYFIDRLDVFKADGSNLDPILVNGSSTQYIAEASQNQVHTKFLDLDDDLITVKIESVINGETTNLNTLLISELDSTENIFDLEQLTPFIFDLNGNSQVPETLRNIVIRTTLINDNFESVAQQSKTYKLIQYPFFPQDFRLTAQPLNKKVGETPKFAVAISQRLPDSFIGFNIIIYSTDSSLDTPEHQTIVYNSDLGCSFQCNKRIEVDDWVYEEEKIYFVRFQALFNTEYANFESSSSNYEITVPVSYRDFDTARILQVFERTDNTYRNNEPIALVLQVRDIPSISLADRIDAYITVDQCPGSTGGCDLNGSIRFLPVKHVYDEITGYNYWYFNSIFFNDAGVLFDDANYLRIRANLTDKLYGHDVDNMPVPTLANKCGSVTDEFNLGSFLMNFFSGIGCTNPAEEIVQLSDAQESRILLHNAHDVNGQLNHSVACIKPDNDRYVDSIEQDLYCAIIYRRQEQAIDGFNIFIGNEFSDYAKTDSSEKQYIEFPIPIESVIFNDPVLMKRALEQGSTTDSIDTIGEFLFVGFDQVFTGIANPLAEAPTGLTDAGIITNMNWDINFAGAIHPNVFSGIFFVKLEGLKVVNQYNYTQDFPELATLHPKYFKAFATQNNIRLPNDDTIVTIYGGDMETLEKFEVDSPLVVFAKPSNATSNEALNDTNTTRVAPTLLKFDYIVDMTYFNETASQRKHLPLTLTFFPREMFSLGGIIEGFWFMVNDPKGWIEQNAIYIALLILLIAFASLIFKNIKSGQPPIPTVVNIDGSGGV